MNGKPVIKDFFGLAARFTVGGIFIYAGFLKAVAPAEDFAYAIEAYKVLPAGLALPVALAVPWIEIYLGVFMAAGVFISQSALCIGVLLLGFEGLLFQAIIRKLPITSCGCFGASKSASPGHEFAENLAIICILSLAFKYGKKLSLDSLIDSHEN